MRKLLSLFLLIFLPVCLIAMEEDSSQKVYIQTNDSEKPFSISNFKLDYCGLLKKLMNDIQDDNSIPLKEVNSKNFALFLNLVSSIDHDRLNHFPDDDRFSIEALKQLTIIYIDRLLLNQKKLIHLINTANYLDCKIILDAAIIVYAQKFSEHRDNATWQKRNTKLPPEMDCLVAEHMMSIPMFPMFSPYTNKDKDSEKIISFLDFFASPKGIVLEKSKNIRRPSTTFSPDGSLFATASGKTGGVFIWNTKTGKLTHELQNVKHDQFVQDFEDNTIPPRSTCTFNKKGTLFALGNFSGDTRSNLYLSPSITIGI